MKVAVSVPGLFHGHYLAAQLDRHGALDRFITTYPLPYMLTRSPARITWHRLRCSNLHLVARILGRIGVARSAAVEHAVRELHDTYASLLSYRNTDIFVGWSGGSTRALAMARRRGLVTVVVRGSSHILEQRRLLEDEHAAFGIPMATYGADVDRQLAEYESAHYIQTNSHFAANTFVARGIAKERVLVNNTGADLASFRQVPKTDDVFRVIVAGTLSLRKGSYYLLKAFCELKLPDAELVHLGHVDSNVAPLLASYLKQPSVRSLGFKPAHELHRHYGQGSVFVMPSIEEGLAQVQTQAMACGLPLICSTNSGGADLIADNEGFVVPIRDVDALKDKLSYLYDNRDACEHMGRAAKRRVHDHFTWDHYGDRMIAIYQQLLSN